MDPNFGLNGRGGKKSFFCCWIDSAVKGVEEGGLRLVSKEGGGEEEEEEEVH